MTSKASPDSESDSVVERGEVYRHDKHGCVEVTGIWRGVSRVDEAHHTDEMDTIIVRYLSEQEGNPVDLTDTLDEFIEAIE